MHALHAERVLKIAGALSLALLVVLAGCGPGDLPAFHRRPLTLDELAVRVEASPRSYLLSDRSGGFLFGEARRDAAFPRDQWTVWGKEMAGRIVMTIDGTDLGGPCDSIVVAPDRIDRWFPGGVHTTTALVSLPVAGSYTHALRVTVSGAAGRAVGISLRGGGGGPVTSVGPMEERDTTMAEATGTVAALFLACPPLPVGVDRPSLLRLAKAGVEERRRAMEGMLADAYLRVSDERLTHAAAWARLTLDALMVRGEDTLIVSGLPWDGAWSGRDNAQALSGLTSLSGSGPETAAIIRALGRRQDTVRSHRTYGRIADRFGAGWSRFEGADVAPSLIRGMYEAVAVTNDTALVRECWPLLRRSVAGIRDGAVDSSNFLLHDPGQTWMTGVDRGRCAAELQLLWHFEQIIGSYVASFIGDTLAAAGLRASGIRTIEEFNKRFVDTTTFTVFDHLDEHGRGVHRSGPNALMCLEAVGQTLTLRNVVRSAAESLFHPCGVASLAAGARGYVPGPDADGRHAYDGAVWTWLTGPAVYGLTRFDAQDVAFRLTQNHAGRMLGRGVVGALPEMITVRPNDAEEGGEDAGRACSATGLAEFSRVLIQDYLGIRIDASAGELMVQPKLPPGVTTADLTVRVSGEPVDVRYDARTMPARVVIGRHGGDSPLHVRVIWLLPSGDAWRGRVDVLPDQEVTLVIGEEEMFAQEGSTRVPVVNPAKIRGFSQRADLGDVRLVGP